MPIKQAEITGVTRYLDRGNAYNQAIEHSCGQQLKACLTLATGALSINNLGPIFPMGDQVWYHLWRVLQVGIKNDDGVPLRIIKPSRDSDLVSKVARKID